MRLLSRLTNGIRALFRRRTADEELDAELHAFLETAVDEKMHSGMSRGEATRSARLETGLVSTGSVKERVHDVGWEVWIDTLWQDVRFAARLLVKDRSFTIAAVVALGLAMGLNTSVFAIINTAFLRDVPLDEPDVSYADLREWRERTISFEGLAANGPRPP
jgi:hypothetical protein